jgi:hypothetical protein
MTIRHRRGIWIAVGIIAALAIAIPVLGADPSPSASPSDQASPDATASPEATASPDATATPVQTAPQPAKPDRTAEPATTAAPDESAEPGDDQGGPHGSGKPDKADKQPEVDVTVQGTVQQTTDSEGRPAFTLTAAGKTWQLSAGPPWFWGDKNPLKPYVGKSVTIAGSSETEDGATELDVSTVNGTAIRAPGKPPWAGGPWVVGPTHPGWKSWMAGGKPGKHDDEKTATPTPTATP